MAKAREGDGFKKKRGGQQNKISGGEFEDRN